MMATEEKIAAIVRKCLTNKDWQHIILKRVSTALLELDEYENGAVLSEEEFETLNAFAEVF